MAGRHLTCYREALQRGIDTLAEKLIILWWFGIVPFNKEKIPLQYASSALGKPICTVQVSA